MMFGGENGKKPGERKENSATPEDPHHEHQNFSSDDSSSAPRGELSQGKGIAEREEEDEAVIRLDHFRKAVEDYPTTTRLIILEHFK